MKGKHNTLHYFLTAFVFLIKGVISSFVWIMVIFVGIIIFNLHKSPYDIVIGIPLMLIAGGFVVHNLWSAVLAFFSPTFNREECRLCSK